MNNSTDKFAKIKKIFSASFPVILVLVILAIFIVALWKIPQWQVSNLSYGINDSIKLAELEDKFRSTIAQILGGFVIVIGLYLTHRRVSATEKNLLVTQEGQITERFTRAIEHLGKDQLEFKLGGIYALERIANESEVDHWPIMEILCAYVRKNSPISLESELISGSELSVDIQAALTVIVRRNKKHEKDVFIKKFDLSNSYLVGSNLSAPGLLVVDFVGANFSNSNISNSDLSLLDLSVSDLSNSTISNSDLSFIDLSTSDITNVNFSHSELSGSNICEADLSNSNLSNATLRDASLLDSNLTNANLSGAVLTGANLTDAILSGADLTNANLTDANLSGAVLTGANLTNAIFSGADLTSANLTGANLSGADFSGATIKGTILDN